MFAMAVVVSVCKTSGVFARVILLVPTGNTIWLPNADCRALPMQGNCGVRREVAKGKRAVLCTDVWDSDLYVRRRSG